MSWNLLARCKSVEKMMPQHLEWKVDSLVITFAMHKGGQEGEGMGREKHVYANIVCAHVCPILSSGMEPCLGHRKCFLAGYKKVDMGKFLNRIRKESAN